MLSARRVETLAFGKSGHGPIHSKLVCGKYAAHFDLDTVVYVFCENDPGDQVEAIKRKEWLPYAELSDGRVTVTDDLLREYRRKRKTTDRLWMVYRSALYQTICAKLSVAAEESEEVDDVPDQNDPPSTWPEDLRTHAAALGEAVLDEWVDKVRADGRKFAVLYVPNEGELTKKDEDQDTWKVWLKTWCAKKKVPFIDPSSAFTAAAAGGTKVYDDHLSVDGHRVFARVFADWFEARP
jgi:hypothetical protein